MLQIALKILIYANFCIDNANLLFYDTIKMLYVSVLARENYTVLSKRI